MVSFVHADAPDRNTDGLLFVTNYRIYFVRLID